MLNLAITFTEEATNPDCTVEDALKDGLTVALYEGTCTDITNGPLAANLNPFVVHTVGDSSYGTFFESLAPETISPRMVAVPPPPIWVCGEWSLNLEFTGLDTTAIFYGSDIANPFALELTDASGSVSRCIDIDNAIVGTAIDAPTRTMRRDVRP